MSKEYKPVRYVVLNEHTLAVSGGYCDDGSAQVLAADKDGYNHLDGPVRLFGLTVRAATPLDFGRFRCAVPPDFAPDPATERSSNRPREG